MQVSRTAYRASLLFLNPFLTRASLASCPSTNIPALRHLTAFAQLHTLLFPQCSPTFKQPDLIREGHTMATPDSNSNTNNPARETKPEEQTQEYAQVDSKGEHLYLPSSPSNENNGKEKGEGQQHRLSLNDDSGSTVTLDHLGPMVVNTDGTLSRISNWEQMTEIEKKNTMRILGKRNKQRLEAVRAAEQGGK